MKRLISLLLLAVCSSAHASIGYTVEVLPATQELSVTILIPVSGDQTELQIPRWSPGAYHLSTTYKSINNFKVLDSRGKELTFTKPDDATWSINTRGERSLKVSYSFQRPPTNDTLHYSGPSTYMYVVGRKGEACNLALKMPEGWTSMCGLDTTISPNNYTASDYDVLADNPVSMGKLAVDTYTVGGVPHYICYQRGEPPASLDRAKVRQVCEYVTRSEGDFWGGFPFKKYVWHFNVRDGVGGGGGLEHLSSTEISFASAFSEGAQGVLAHEYFHAWNVKRIRSFVLGPFDYTDLPKTGALWWLEGVTDYYAAVLRHRYGLIDDGGFLRVLAGQVQSYRTNAAHTEISPYWSSFRVREAAGRQGNSSGYKISYYTQGWVIGMCMDIKLRALTNNRVSLDTVAQALWQQCRNSQPGFQEDDIRGHLVRLGGPVMGAYYDKYIQNPGDFPVEEELAKVGLVLNNSATPYVVSDSPSLTAQQTLLRTAWYFAGKSKLIVPATPVPPAKPN